MRAKRPFGHPVAEIVTGIAAIAVAAASPPVLVDLWASLLVFAVAAIGLNIVSGNAGQISLGHAALVGVGAYTAGAIASRWSSQLPVTLIASAVGGGLVGLLFGAPSLRVRGQFLALVTIAGGFIFVRIVSGSRALGAEQGMIDIPFAHVGGDLLGPKGHAVVLAALFAISVWIAGSITRSWRGRALVVMRTDERVAEASGIDVYRAKLTTFVLSAVMASVAGALFAHKEGFISPSSFDLDLSLMLMLACVIGGMGRPLGGPIGVFVMMGPFLMIPGADRFELGISAAVALAVIFFMPSGLAGATRARRGHRGLSTLRVKDVEPVPLPVVASSTQEPLLVAEGLGKRFGGVTALDGVGIEAVPGAIHAVIGPNGSGKTTLIDCLTGVLVPDAGWVRVAGVEVTGWRAHKIARAGVSRTFQETVAIRGLSVIESMLLGRDRSRTERLLGRAVHELSRLGLDGLEQAGAAELSYGQLRRLEIARALARDPRVLILDEPAAGLGPAEVGELGKILLDLKPLGIAIILVDHHMNFVLEVANHVVVLDSGKPIASGAGEQVMRDPLVATVYLGERVQG